MTQTAVDHAQLAIAVEEIRTLRDCHDACRRGMARDPANASYYYEMISLLEDVHTEWVAGKEGLERGAARA
jgi:hypothetical protein